MKIRFNSMYCEVVKRQYDNGRTSLVLIDAVDGSPVAIASVNLVNEAMKRDEVAIKDYSENEGMLNTLIEEGIVSHPIRHTIHSFPICKLLI